MYIVALLRLFQHTKILVYCMSVIIDVNLCCLCFKYMLEGHLVFFRMVRPALR